MKKNVASQKIGAQMCSATDGSAFTGTVTVYVTLDAGTQAIGTVGSGICTHEGNGYHTYAPSQAETNGDLAAYTFIGTGAIPSTVQVYTTFPQTGDSFGLIGATGSGLTSLASAANLATVAGYLDTEVAAIKAKTDNLPASPAATGDAMTLTGAAVDAVLDDVVEGTTTLRQMLRGFASALLGKASGLATATAVFRDVGDTKDRITATVDASGNRTAVTLDLT